MPEVGRFLDPLYMPSVDSLSEANDMSGWLMKQGHIVHNWKKRWVVVVGGYLFYFKTQESSAPAGHIELSTSRAAWAIDKAKSGKDFTLEVVTESSKRLMLAASSQAEADEWLRVILATIKEGTARLARLSTTDSVATTSSAGVWWRGPAGGTGSFQEPKKSVVELSVDPESTEGTEVVDPELTGTEVIDTSEEEDGSTSGDEPAEYVMQDEASIE